MERIVDCLEGFNGIPRLWGHVTDFNSVRMGRHDGKKFFVRPSHHLHNVNEAQKSPNKARVVSPFQCRAIVLRLFYCRERLPVQARGNSGKSVYQFLGSSWWLRLGITVMPDKREPFSSINAPEFRSENICITARMGNFHSGTGRSFPCCASVFVSCRHARQQESRKDFPTTAVRSHGCDRLQWQRAYAAVRRDVQE